VIVKITELAVPLASDGPVIDVGVGSEVVVRAMVVDDLATVRLLPVGLRTRQLPVEVQAPRRGEVVVALESARENAALDVHEPRAPVDEGEAGSGVESRVVRALVDAHFVVGAVRVETAQMERMRGRQAIAQSSDRTELLQSGGTGDVVIVDRVRARTSEEP